MKHHTHSAEKLYIGIDGGGTKTHAILVNQDLRQIDEISSGPANIATDVEGAYVSICEVIDILQSRHDQMANQICIGVAGYSATRNRNILISKLQKKYANIVLNSDCYIACLAAHNNKDGAIIICGTGVVAYSIFNGQGKQLSGWGFPHGDLGGGAYLGLEVSRILCKAIDGLIPWNLTLNDLYLNLFQRDSHIYKMWLMNAKPVDYAKITQFVFLKPADEFSNKLLELGVTEISELVLALKKTNTNLPIKLVGGLAKLYLPKLQREYPEVELSVIDPAFGAVLAMMV